MICGRGHSGGEEVKGVAREQIHAELRSSSGYIALFRHLSAESSFRNLSRGSVMECVANYKRRFDNATKVSTLGPPFCQLVEILADDGVCRIV